MNQKYNKSRTWRAITLLAAAGALLIASNAANAEGGYAGIGIGQSQFDITCDLDISCSADDKDTGWKVYGGYQFHQNGAIEFGYADLGKGTANGVDSFLGTTSATFEASGFAVAAVGFLPVSQTVALMGKVGFFRWDLDVNVTSSVFGSGSVSESGTDPLFGIGASFNVGKNAAVRVEWESFMDIGDEATTGQSDIELLSASFVYRF